MQWIVFLEAYDDIDDEIRQSRCFMCMDTWCGIIVVSIVLVFTLLMCIYLYGWYES
jgi:hypothetical protein